MPNKVRNTGPYEQPHEPALLEINFTAMISCAYPSGIVIVMNK